MAHRRNSEQRGRDGRLATLDPVFKVVRSLPWGRIVALAVIAGVALGGFLIFRSVRAKRRAAAAVVVTKPVVVMPFANVGGDSAQDYLSDGVASELVNALTRNRALRVAPRVTAASLMRQGKTTRQIGALLRVKSVIEGTVRRSGRRIRVTADITNVTDGAQLWSDQVEGDAGDILTLLDDFEQRVASALQTRLGVKPPPPGKGRGTSDGTAFDLYLHGKFLLSKRTEVPVRRAALLFEEAATRDTLFARAVGGLAAAKMIIVQLTPKPDAAQLLEVTTMGERALELDPATSDAHLALGFLTAFRGQNVEIPEALGAQSEQHFKRALSLEPSRLLVHEWYGDLLGKLGRYDEALDQMKVAKLLDPTSARVASEVADVLFNVRYQAALAANMQSSALDTVLSLGFRNYSGALAFLHRSDEMVRAFREVLTLDPNYPTARGHMVYALAATKKRDDAEKLATDLLRDGEAQRATAYEVALSRMGLGDVDGALKWIRKSIELTEVETGPRRLPCDPYFDPLQPDVRFMEIMRKSGARNCLRSR